jgi:hypothetical protein
MRMMTTRTTSNRRRSAAASPGDLFCVNPEGAFWLGAALGQVSRDAMCAL